MSTINLPYLRDQYLLDPEITFLNHGSFGASPRPVFQAYQEWQRELERQPVDFIGRRLPDLLAAARAELAAFVGTSAGNLVFVPNATYGINIVARTLELRPGDQVLSTNHEYGAIDKTWRFNCEKSGATYTTVPIPLPVETHEDFVERFWAAVTPRTRAIAISHITSPTALIFPVAEICRRANQAGIITVIDGAHAPGQVPLALDAWQPTFYTGNAHKWLSAPKGAGFLYVAPAWQGRVEPLVVSHGWRSERPGASPFLDYFSWVGTMDPAAYLSVPAAIRFQEEHGWAHVQAACHTLAAQIRQEVAALTGLPALTPDDGDVWYGQLFAARLPDAQFDAVQQRLWADFRVEAPVYRWQGEPMIRISIQAYNGPADGERLLAALAAIFREG